MLFRSIPASILTSSLISVDRVSICKLRELLLAKAPCHLGLAVNMDAPRYLNVDVPGFLCYRVHLN
mgnify:CR=1 FL=1